MKINLLIAFSLVIGSLFSQQGDGGFPPSAKFPFEPEIPKVSFAQPDLVGLAIEDTERDAKGEGPWRFGYINSTHLTLDNSGAWFQLANGAKVWMLELACENALTVNLTFKNSFIPEGNELFVYAPDRSVILGKFTQRHLVNGALGAELIQGSRTIVEYYVAPHNENNVGQIQIAEVVHGYRTIEGYKRAFGDAGACNMNINCPDGLMFYKQRNSTVMLVSGSNGFCTGALINNTNNDGKPYVLTARHCGNSGFENWIFRFNWQSEDCNNPTSSPGFQSLSGAVNRAGSLNNTFDMRLVEITGGLENGTVPASYNPFFAGWDNSGVVPSNTFCVHHPNGDIKKIAFDDHPPVITQAMGSNVPNSVWEVVWDRNTTTEPGSSGSPLFDNYGRIIGQLWGGGASCSQLNSPDYYGRLSMSWNPENSTPDQQLKHWLDPNDSGVTFINGFPESDPPELDAGIVPSSNWALNGAICASSVTPIFNLINFGSENITNAVINYSFNSGSTQEYAWTGDLAYGQMATITLPTQNLASGNYEFNATLVSINGQNDENSNNNQINSSFSFIENGFNVNMTLTLDCYGTETTWRLLNVNQTEVLASGGPYSASFFNQTTVNQTWCLAEDCYVFEINDSDGDGLSGGGFCPFIGSLSIAEGSTTLAQISSSDANFGSQKKFVICLGEATNRLDELNHFQVNLYPNPVEETLNVNFNQSGFKLIQVFSASGILIFDEESNNLKWSFDTKGLAPGLYFIQVKFGNVVQTLKFSKQ